MAKQGFFDNSLKNFIQNLIGKKPKKTVVKHIDNIWNVDLLDTIVQREKICAEKNITCF